jgi:16S rRNA (uracil1498-N3)-methyltransferase
LSQFWAWVEDLVEPGSITLSPDESRHLATRRLRVGDECVVFDARGRTANARVLDIVRRAVCLDVGEIRVRPPPEIRFGLATAIPKGDRLSTMLQMWTQLGLDVWQPLILEDSAVRALDVEAPRLRRILIEACKVARRPWALRVAPPLRLDEALGRHAQNELLFYGDREGSPPDFGGGEGWVYIGPEAGFSASERARLVSAGARPIRFGEYNQRIETAAVAAVAAFNATRSVR